MPTFQDNRQLLCTFSSDKDYRKTVDEILDFYEVYSRRVFAFSNVKNPKEVFLTYNVLNMKRDAPKFPNTILIHRKKQTNTLYTLNAMNQIIKDENEGVFDKSFSVNWPLYSNSLIITGVPAIRVLPIKILEIVS